MDQNDQTQFLIYANGIDEEKEFFLLLLFICFLEMEWILNICENDTSVHE